MFEKYRNVVGFVEVPGSNGKLVIDVNGSVKDHSGDCLKLKHNVQGDLCVWSDLWSGKGYYPISLLSVVTFKDPNIPRSLWGNIEPFHIDGNLENLHAGNIGYRFSNGKLQVPDLPDYYYLPMATHYAINTEGDLHDLRSGKSRTWKISKPRERNGKGGYREATVMGDLGYTTYNRHRSLGLVFLTYPNNVDSMDINHKDGVPGNDTLDNLEWVTRRGNIKHASESGLKGQNKAVQVRCFLTGTVVEYGSLRLCSSSWKLSCPEVVRWRIRQGPEFIYDGHQWRYKSDEPWPKPVSPTAGVIARETSTGKEYHFTDKHEAALKLNINKSDIERALRVSSGELVGDYEFKREGSSAPWGVLKSTRPKVKEIITEDVDTGERLSHSSLRQLGEFLNTTTRYSLKKRLDSETKIRYGKYFISYA